MGAPGTVHRRDRRGVGGCTGPVLCPPAKELLGMTIPSSLKTRGLEGLHPAAHTTGCGTQMRFLVHQSIPEHTQCTAQLRTFAKLSSTPRVLLHPELHP